MTRKQKKMLLRIVLSAALMLALHFVPATGWARFGLYLIPYLIAGHDILRSALRGIRNGQVFDENFLMAVATVGALVLGITGSGDYTEAVAVMVFYQTGELFQSIAVGKSRRSIAALMDIRPDYANLEQGGQLVQVAPEEVEIGTVILVQPGEKIPIDGVIVQGFSTLNTAALTGESSPRDVAEGDALCSGCVNMTGVLKLRTTKEFGESTVSRILDLVENASSRKSRSEAFISRFARIYTPAVCGAALLLAVLPPAVLLVMGQPPLWEDWIYRALTFLVISCPCALVISIPLTFFAGIGGAGSVGVLVKGSNYLEALAKAETVVFDKTGTLTRGSFQVTDIVAVGWSREQLLEAAALAEWASSHPIGKSLRSAYGKELDRSRVENVRQISGQGVTAVVDGTLIAVGNEKLMSALGIAVSPPDRAGTVLYAARNGEFGGYFVIQDVLKPTAKAAVAALKAAGVAETVMLSGDSQASAREIARVLGIRKFHGQLLPEDKVSIVEGLLEAKTPGSTLVFAGDGINDAPVLSCADIGIAMGAMGTDAAIEAADIVLMDDDPMKISQAIRIARKCMAIVRQNITLALGVKGLCLLLVALGAANMWLGIFADVGVMVLAVLNAIRALFVKRL